MHLLGYTLADPLWVGTRHTTYRARHQLDGRDVIIKIPQAPDVLPSLKAARLRRAFVVGRAFSGPGVVRPLAVEPYQATVALVTEDFGGVCLARLLEERPIDDLAFSCQVGLQMADILGRMHDQGIVHKDVKTANFIVRPDSLETRLTDFSVSSRLSWEESTITTFDQLEGTLSYMAPEQTGRINRNVDWRSDLYSLGVSLYHMLTRGLPFSSGDPIELMYNHIVTVPPPPHEVNPLIPAALSAVVMRLLSKDAEDRYQSAQGVKADLAHCLAQWQKRRRIAFFNPGTHDASQVFRIPQKLYGRDPEVATLRQAFDTAARGETVLVLVTGAAGIGKSALVGELREPTNRHRGHFVTGKFDQYERHVPYAAFVQAFRQLVRHLLTESEMRLQGWRSRLAEALGVNGQVLVDVVPEVEVILGPQPPVPELTTDAAEKRFRLVIGEFVRVLAARDHPLTIFLDDLQWADGSSLKLIQQLIADRETRSLLLVAAYRDTEMDPDSDMLTLVDALKGERRPVFRIHLDPLERVHLGAMVSDTLRTISDPVADLVAARTGGNPFFIAQFLLTLYRRGLLSWSAGQSAWTWDMERLRTEAWTEDLVDLIIARLQELPPEAVSLLQMASCIGKSFLHRTLSTAAGIDPREVAARLEAPLREGLIVPLDSRYKYDDLEEQCTYTFLHDRVQQAAYATIPDKERSPLHARIGRLLLRDATSEDLQERLFEVVGHLNAAQDLLSPDEKTTLAELNLAAARKANASAAWPAARRLLETGLGLLPESGWEASYELAFDAHLELIRTLSMLHEDEAIEKVAKSASTHARDLLDHTRVLELRLCAYAQRLQWKQVLDVGLETIGLLGEPLTAHPLRGDMLTELNAVGELLRPLNPDQLLALPAMTDGSKLAAMRILRAMGSAAYSTRLYLYPFIICRMVRLSIRYGNCGESAYGYVGYGLVLSALQGQLERGYQMGQVAISVLDRHPARYLQGRIHVMFNVFIRHWIAPLAETIPALRNSGRWALENGDAEYWSYSLFWIGCLGLYVGQNLTELRDYVDRTLQSLLGRGQGNGLRLLHLRHLVDELMASPDSAPLPDDQPESTLVQRWTQAGDWNSLCQAYGCQAIGRFLLRDYQGCLDQMGLCETHLTVLAGQPCLPVFRFYHALALLAIGRSRPAAAIRRQLQVWARACPANYEHRLRLVEAEAWRVAGRDIDLVLRTYERGIDAAQRQGFLLDEAIGCELAGRYLMGRGHPTAAMAYLRRAVSLYARWGGRAVAAGLVAEFPDANLALLVAPTDTTSPVPTPPDVDTQATLEAAQALSGEIVLDDLVRRLMRLLVQVGGADQAFLLLASDHGLHIAGQGSAQGLDVFIHDPLPLAERLPATVATYVLRTQEALVLDNARADARFARDPYLAERPRLSVMCVPLLRQGVVVGVVYLENPLLQGAFTARHVRLVQVLAAQAAISIENARHFHRQQQQHNLILAEREQRHQEALKAQAMEARRNAAVAFLAIASHDLKNPIMGIRTWSALLTTADEQRRIECQRAIESCCQRAESLVLGYLDVAVADMGGTLRLQTARLDLRHLVEQEIEFQLDALPPLTRANTHLTWDLDDAEVNADPDRMQQVVSNLLGNAIRYAGSYGPITVGLRCGDGLVRFTIDDQGPGFPATYMEKSFQPFERGVTGAAGNGLGLWISRVIVEVHGGRIGVHAQPGGGACVWFELPAAGEV